jgi:hypothetical protein
MYPGTTITPTILDEPLSAVASIPIETAGTYGVRVHAHYYGTQTCAVVINFDVK